MNPDSSAVRQSFSAKFLAVFSLATFWAIPFAPLVIIAALSKSKNSTGWVRRLSVSAAIVCSVYTIAIAAWVLCLAIYVLTGGQLA
ncbi:MAG: hypothetical protein KF752_19415 [Pirellulaceae bacterium]|nr:hypothetical protein [Pirellulaceae bacterium]